MNNRQTNKQTLALACHSPSDSANTSTQQKCTHTPTHTCTHTHALTHMHSHTCTHTHALSLSFSQSFTHTHIVTDTHTHIVTDTHTLTLSLTHTRSHCHCHTHTTLSLTQMHLLCQFTLKQASGLVHGSRQLLLHVAVVVGHTQGTSTGHCSVHTTLPYTILQASEHTHACVHTHTTCTPPNTPPHTLCFSTSCTAFVLSNTSSLKTFANISMATGSNWRVCVCVRERGELNT